MGKKKSELELYEQKMVNMEWNQEWMENRNAIEIENDRE